MLAGGCVRAGDDEASVRVSQAAERVASLFADRAQLAEVDTFFAKHKASRLLGLPSLGGNAAWAVGLPVSHEQAPAVRRGGLGSSRWESRLRLWSC